MKEIVLPSGVKMIGNGSFASCASLTDILIPDSVTLIGTGAFGGCTSLTGVHYGGDSVTWNQISISDGNDILLEQSIHFNATELIVIRESGTMTDESGPAVQWTYFSNRAITVNGEITPDAPLYLATYEESGRMISLTVLTGPDSMSADGHMVKLFWVDDQFKPRCGAVAIQLN